MSAHKVIAAIITCATSVKKKRGEIREGREWVEKPPRTFDLNEAGYKYS